MRRIVLSFVCVFMACVASHAQGVKFESGTWDEIQTKAKAENKIIFVDVYTVWCGPCKHVAQTVFPQEKVGEVYNSQFINFKMDAESPAGKEFVKSYPVSAYPTFLFIDKDGKLIHKILGAKGAEEFLQEAKMVKMYARHGGMDNMMAAVKNGTANRELLSDYYASAGKGSKAEALNFYLKALPTEEIVDENNKLLSDIEDYPFYDKDLMIRIIDGIVKASNDGRYSGEKYPELFSFNIAFPVQRTISVFLTKSIEQGNWKWFNELLELRERFADFAGKNFKGYNLLVDKDLLVEWGRGLFFAVPEYSKLCYWYWNKDYENEDEFKSTLVAFMDRLIRENHVDSLLVENRNAILQTVKVKGLTRDFAYVAGPYIFDPGNYTCKNIIDWTEYFWKLSPSDKKTKELCSRWLNYVFNVNRFNTRVSIPAADLLARIGNAKDAKIMMEKAIAAQKELKIEDPKVYKPLEQKLRDINNRKL